MMLYLPDDLAAIFVAWCDYRQVSSALAEFERRSA